MAILRSAEGKFYDVPDEELANYEVPADQVNEMISGGGFGQGPAPGPGPGGGPGEGVQPYHYCGFFRNRFRNCGFRNYGFRNYCGFRNCAGR